MHKLIFGGFHSWLWAEDISIHGTPETQVLNRCDYAAAGEYTSPLFQCESVPQRYPKTKTQGRKYNL